jgi:hypothetical protein
VNAEGRYTAGRTSEDCRSPVTACSVASCTAAIAAVLGVVGTFMVVG